MNEQQSAVRDDLWDDVMDKTGDGKCPADGCGQVIAIHERTTQEAGHKRWTMRARCPANWEHFRHDSPGVILP